MASSFKILTDNGSDLPSEFLEKYDIAQICLSTMLNGETINGQDRKLPAEEFYKLLSKGARPTTSQVNPEQAEEFLEAHRDDADEFLYVGLSSGLSGTVGSMKIGAEAFMKHHPEKKVEIVDSLGGSIGEGLVVYYAAKYRAEGKSLEETAETLRYIASHVHHSITVDNLFDLWRGGRVSRSSAIIGSIASIKPFIEVNKDGRLDVTKKILGRKKSLNFLVDFMEERSKGFEAYNREMVMIAHGNCPEDAAYVAEQIGKRLGCHHILTANVGPMIGTHTGGSIVVVSFIGSER
ncbi:MAG: DegV family protein [Lachnospiraceae bacterium]|nr:DegV family protein [Lachnospiraceae bacterium]MBP5253794.1 DegV family protein [Lachnospiraceae bacterium]